MQGPRCFCALKTKMAKPLSVWRDRGLLKLGEDEVSPEQSRQQDGTEPLRFQHLRDKQSKETTVRRGSRQAWCPAVLLLVVVVGCQAGGAQPMVSQLTDGED